MAERSFNEIRAILSESLPKPSKADGYTYINDCGADWVVYYDSGKLKKCSYSIDDSGKATLGEPSEVVERTVYEPVAMSVFSTDAKTTVWKGLIFKAGDYPDKGLSFSEADLDEMVSTFSERAISLSHLLFDPENKIETVLDGAMGAIKKIWRKGAELFGEVHVPTWMNEAIPEEKRKVSIETYGNTLTGISLVPYPRVESAALRAAYAKFCATQTVSADVADKSMAVQPANGGNKTMSLKERILALFGQDAKEKEAELQAVIDSAEELKPPEPPAVKPEQPNAELAAMKAQNEALMAQVQSQEAARLTEKAEAFADGLLHGEKIVPAQRDSVISLYKNAVKADSAGKSCFSADGKVIEGESVKAIAAAFENAPTHGLLHEQAKIAMSGDSGEGLSDDKRKSLLETTPLGRAVAADKAKEGK